MGLVVVTGDLDEVEVVGLLPGELEGAVVEGLEGVDDRFEVRED